MNFNETYADKIAASRTAKSHLFACVSVLLILWAIFFGLMFFAFSHAAKIVALREEAARCHCKGDCCK